MSQRTILHQFYSSFRLHVSPPVIRVFAAILALIGCLSAGPAGAGQPAEAPQAAIADSGPLKLIGVPVAGVGYIDPTFSGNSRRFIAITDHAMNETARVWDVSTLKPLCNSLPATGPDYGLTFHGKIAFTTDDKTIRFWNVDTSKLIRATKITQGELKDVAISPDCTQFLAIVKGEQAVEVWHTGEARPRLLIKQDAVDVAFDPTGD